MRFALLVLLSPVLANAQSAANEPGYVIVLASTAAPALLFDGLVAGSLISTGEVRKGFALNAVIFGAIATTIGAGLTFLFIGDTRVKPIWTPLAASLGVVGVGSIVLGIYSLIRAKPAEIVPTDALPPESIPLTPSPPPLPPEIPQLLFGVSPSGGVFFGLSGRL